MSNGNSHDNFPFRYPPPPPLPGYSPTPPPPPPPATTTCIVQPPPLPPQTTNASWRNFDFSRPPPPLVNGLHSSTTNGISFRNRKRISSPRLSPGSNQDNFSYYGFNNDTTHPYMMNSRQYPTRRYYGSSDLKYPRRTPVIDTRSATYSRPSTSAGSNSSSKDITHQEAPQRSRKRKKPLSQAVPSKRGWTDEEAEMALSVEREFNKTVKGHSIKIKFPDQELNRDIVSNFHSAIENVYFQQSSSPRYCFITVSDDADSNQVIESLNQIDFGLGKLSAEYKKDREEEQLVSRYDIDPLTLYVGNLHADVLKEEIVSLFPKYRRIDIGFAKKIKQTRYAFVSFNNVQDAIESFKERHNADMNSKSIIVRFRRLHGTAGMPGEPKLQHPSRQIQDDTRRTQSGSVNSAELPTFNSEHGGTVDSDEIRFSSPVQSPKDYPSHNDSDQRTMSECSDSSTFDPNLVKNEPYEYPDDDIHSYLSEDDCEQSETERQHFPTQTENLESHNLISAAIIKKDPEFTAPIESGHSITSPIIPISLKQEPKEEEESFVESSVNKNIDEDSSSLDNRYKKPKKEAEIPEPNPDDNEEEFNTTTDFGYVIDNLKKRQSFVP